MKRKDLLKSFAAAALVAASLAPLGCVTESALNKKLADQQAQTDRKIESVAGQVEDIQDKQTKMAARVEELGQSAAEALRRAQEAGVLAQGKVVFQETFSEDRIRFKTNSYELTKDAKEALDELALKIKALDRVVYVEVQGHTDDTGGAEYNDMLGQQRAEAVRRYISRQHKLPLGRISTISYGDTLPIEPNRTKKGRDKNRRVVVVVLE